MPSRVFPPSPSRSRGLDRPAAKRRSFASLRCDKRMKKDCRFAAVLFCGRGAQIKVLPAFSKAAGVQGAEPLQENPPLSGGFCQGKRNSGCASVRASGGRIPSNGRRNGSPAKDAPAVSGGRHVFYCIFHTAVLRRHFYGGFCRCSAPAPRKPLKRLDRNFYCASIRRASRYPGSPWPRTVPIHAARMYDTCRNSSRLSGSDTCTSTVGIPTAFTASSSATLVWV